MYTDNYNYRFFGKKYTRYFTFLSIIQKIENDVKNLNNLRESFERSLDKLTTCDLAPDKSELFRITSVRVLYKIIASEAKKFLSDIITECEEILGQAPCKYAVIALGSLALTQFTPYSDLEFAILMGDEANEIKSIKGVWGFEDLPYKTFCRQYFKNLSQLIHFRIINLGETIIPESKFEFSLDQYVKRGISFDLGGKTPLGRVEKEYELINTVDDMLQNLVISLSENSSRVRIVDANLPYILEAVTHITGDKTMMCQHFSGQIFTQFFVLIRILLVTNNH